MAVLIVVEDIEKSKNFYEKVLGQTIKIDYGENVTFVGDFAIHKESHFQNHLFGTKCGCILWLETKFPAFEFKCCTIKTPAGL